MIDTLRLVVGWDCNLKCGYCCNNIQKFRKEFEPVRLEEVDWKKYKTVCITGGEPLLMMDRVERVCKEIEASGTKPLIVMYTNGTLLTRWAVEKLTKAGVRALSIGLHEPKEFRLIVSQVLNAALGSPELSLRFCAWERYAGMSALEDYRSHYTPPKFGVEFKLWTLNDCVRENEERRWLRDE